MQNSSVILNGVITPVSDKVSSKTVATVESNHQLMETLKGTVDWVFVDAPCSGTGTLRRNPDLKWRFSTEKLQKLVQLQRDIFSEALQYLRPNGNIVYGTCSILCEENQEQLAYFMDKHNLTLRGQPLQTFPTVRGMDGFYGAVLGRNIKKKKRQ